MLWAQVASAILFVMIDSIVMIAITGMIAIIAIIAMNL